jgi:hypothetical protein
VTESLESLDLKVCDELDEPIHAPFIDANSNYNLLRNLRGGIETSPDPINSGYSFRSKICLHIKALKHHQPSVEGRSRIGSVSNTRELMIKNFNGTKSNIGDSIC